MHQKDDTYRQAASVLLLRPSAVCTPDGCGEAYQILLLHKPRKRDAWQLPQGGVEGGETTTQAALRELHEEAGIGDAHVIGESVQCYKYDFPETFRRFRPDNVCGQCIRFVFALCSSDTRVTVDANEIDSFAWVDSEQVNFYIKRKEYLELVKKMYEEAQGLLSTNH